MQTDCHLRRYRRNKKVQITAPHATQNFFGNSGTVTYGVAEGVCFTRDIKSQCIHFKGSDSPYNKDHFPEASPPQNFALVCRNQTTLFQQALQLCHCWILPSQNYWGLTDFLYMSYFWLFHYWYLQERCSAGGILLHSVDHASTLLGLDYSEPNWNK